MITELTYIFCKLTDTIDTWLKDKLIKQGCDGFNFYELYKKGLKIEKKTATDDNVDLISYILKDGDRIIDILNITISTK